MLKLSLISFGVGGLFLNLSTFDLMYLLLATVALCRGIVTEKLREAGVEPGAVPIPSFRRVATPGIEPELATAQIGFRRSD
jgi:hypothetical protein